MQDKVISQASLSAAKYRELADRIQQASEARERTDTAWLLTIAENIGEIKRDVTKLEEAIIDAAEEHRISSPELAHKLNSSASTVARRWRQVRASRE